MAIIDHSFATEFFARAITSKSGIDELNKILSNGNMPEEYKKDLEQFILEEVSKNGGKAPDELSYRAARRIHAYSSLSVSVIRKILVSTNFFGIVKKKGTISRVGRTEPYTNNSKSQAYSQERYNKTIGKFGTPRVETVDGSEVTIVSPSLANAARAMTGAPVDDPVEIITPKQRTGGPAPYEIGSNDKQDIQPGEDFVSSAEELDAEFANVTRDISEIIVHFSETSQNANLNKDQLKDIASEGKYHYVIKRDGAIQRDVPLNASGSHTPENGHDGPSVGVCLVGGLTSASGEEAIGPEVDASALTRSQYTSLYHIFDAFFRHHPGGQALGHSEINPDMYDPGFDVRDYVFAKFNKISLYENPEKDAALTKPKIIEFTSGNMGSPILTKDPELEKKYQ